MAASIDLNCDLGEGVGPDAEVLPWITTANVACGFHAGGPEVAAEVLRTAARLGKRIGAHPGFADREHFGRREQVLAPQQLFAETVYQIGALAGLARSAGVALAHLKPHGALYHQAGRDDAYAEPLVEAACLFGLALIGPPGSRLEARAAGRCPFVAEGFADRRYRADGSLVPRSEPGALIHDAEEAADQVARLIRGGTVQTICIHGDSPDVLPFLRRLRECLERRSIEVRPFDLPASSP